MKGTVLRGLAAGACAGLAMKIFVECVDPSAFGLSARTDARTTHEVWSRLDWAPLSERRAAQVGAAIHYGFSAAAGSAYAVAQERFRAFGAGRGSAFGAALWLVGDEVAVTFAGLEDPLTTPLGAHVSALGAHVLFGLLVDALVRA